MLFLNPWLLLGLLGLSVPIILHLFNRRKSRAFDWGAMLFLEESLNQRRRRVLIEEILLLVTRCLIVAAATLVFARPFMASHATIPWIAVLSVGLLAIIAFGVSFAIWNERLWRRRLWIACALLAALAGLAVLTESWAGWRRFGATGARDIAIILDGSSSMTLEIDGLANFTRAVKEAETVIQAAPRNCAFTLIIGGAAPQALTAAPVSDRKHLLRLLDDAVPAQGTFHALDALALAVTSLAQGSHGNKQILVIGDGQSVGWQLGETEIWSYLGDLFDRLPTRPRIVWRTLEMPTGIRNLTVADLTFSREVIGADREVRIDVVVANNGFEAATAQALRLTAGDRTYTDNSIGQLQPGESRTVSFRHRFTRAGTQPVTAALDVTDEMPSDNTTTRIAAVRDSLRVLVVEGGRAPRLAERPGAFLALALAPSPSLLGPPPADEPERKPTAARGTFVVPELIATPVFIAREAFDGYAAVILADVPRFPSNTAARLVRFVERGGGLFVLHGARTDPAFYNQWQTPELRPVMPLALGEQGLADAERDPVMIDALTLIHPALQGWVADGDIASAGFTRYWQSDGASPQSRVGGRLLNGAPLLADQALGKGRILQWTAPIEPAAANLVSRQVFLPLVHELVYYLARPIVPNLNLPPMRGATLTLGSGASAGSDGQALEGLRGIYYRGTEQREALLARTDKQIAFNWGRKSPAPAVPNDHFNVVWSGSLRVPASGRYRLFTRADDRMSLRLDAAGDGRAREASELKVDLDATRRHDLVVRYIESGGAASATLLWEGPGIGAQPIPAKFLSPQRVTGAGWSETHATRVHPPVGEALEATLQRTRDTLALHLPNRMTPGLYQVEVPAVWAPRLMDLATISNGLARITFCVATDGIESRLATITPDEAGFARRFVDLVVAGKTEEMNRAMGGGAVGREFWRFFAVALFFLLVAEIALTRWIAMQRKTGEEAELRFDESSQPAEAFRERLAAMTGSPK
jgi:hypothetical protein